MKVARIPSAAVALFAVSLFASPMFAGESDIPLSPRDERLIGTWEPLNGQHDAAFNRILIRKDGTGQYTLYQKIEHDFEWDFHGAKLVLVYRKANIDLPDFRIVDVAALIRSFLVLHSESPVYYRRK